LTEYAIEVLAVGVGNSSTLRADVLAEITKKEVKRANEKGNGFGYSLFNEKSEYTSTMSARYYKDGSEILIEQKGKNPRKITPREAARLQGFPENFIIPVSDNQAYKQFGNSVAVPVIEELARRIVLEMEKIEDKNKTYRKINIDKIIATNVKPLITA
jgi:DNA (cytosine-5)-methyltransferase 1